jgi:hypothetical protein
MINLVYYSITRLVDIIIENESAFGMKFGNIDFEARWKCGNEIAYPKWPKSEKNWTEEDAVSILEHIREYLMEKFGVEDDEPSGPAG